MPFADFPEPGDKIIEGRVVVQDMNSRSTCNLDNVVDKEPNPVNVRGCKALDDVEVTAYDSNRNVLATGLTYASDRLLLMEDGAVRRRWPTVHVERRDRC